MRATTAVILAAGILLLSGCAAQANATQQAPGNDMPTGPGASAAASQLPSVAAAPASGTDAQHVWEVCYKPDSSADEVTANLNLTNEILTAFPTEWTQNVPVPTGANDGVCHQHVNTAGTGGVKDVWWLHFTDLHAGYAAATAWDAQLKAAGAQAACQPGFGLDQGADAIYSCSYALPTGYQAQISHHTSSSGVDLQIQPPLS
ncbi:hypothetical protein [Microbacterium rhizosphaerae]|uniref:Septum formation-related domain-containing protein n=1 Tax=Microbacterium rhizosphaerae TaxID=1678237 RepID=A0ABZ0SUJ9_9MICO|nr:hypothetical protein [Microbacterium rhizosphaerae]WPR91322.1 hypothetical protein SM116_08615 [Microbacterium rhizosphaerae]